LRTVTIEQLRSDENQWRRTEIELRRNGEINVDELMGSDIGSSAGYDDSAPPRIPSALTKPPRIKEIFWCQFPRDAELPEFWKVRPVVVLSRKVDLNGTVFVVPCTSCDQKGSSDAVEISTTIGGPKTWAICDKPVSVAVSRLRPPKGKPEVTDRELTEIVRKVALLMPHPIVSDAKRAHILRLLQHRHGSRMGSEIKARKVLDDILGWIASIRDH
jgi:mRNA interferase MazF